MILSFNDKTPRIAASAYISEMATIIGDVEIGENCGVFPGAVIRADFATMKIGARSFIEDNCVLHGEFPLEISDNVIIGHGVIMHGGKIGHHTLIGMNSTILNRVEIGNYCLIAAGTLIKVGSKIPDESLVAGVPGIVKKKISEQQRTRLNEGGKVYGELSRRYREMQKQ